jgi:outer membrane protein OmpA-like peptidoglycan-associated protein
LCRSYEKGLKSPPPNCFAKQAEIRCDGRSMAKSLPKASDGTTPVPPGVSAPNTPIGVWVIVGIAVFFVLGGLGVSAFVVWKALGVKKTVPAMIDSAAEKGNPAPSAPTLSDGEVGVEHPSPNRMIDGAGPSPSMVSDRAEEDRVRQEVLQRIDLLKVLTDADKDKLYAQVERARAFVKIAIIPFAQNRMVVGAAQVDGLIKNLNGPHLQKLLADPTVALIVLGYADKKGEEAKNLDISRSRAESVVKALREKMDLVNVMHAVGMGGQDLFDSSDLEKNRVAEVWAVQP